MGKGRMAECFAQGADRVVTLPAPEQTGRGPAARRFTYVSYVWSAAVGGETVKEMLGLLPGGDEPDV
jgi:hypothetical protein